MEILNGFFLRINRGFTVGRTSFVGFTRGKYCNCQNKCSEKNVAFFYPWRHVILV